MELRKQRKETRERERFAKVFKRRTLDKNLQKTIEIEAGKKERQSGEDDQF